MSAKPSPENDKVYIIHLVANRDLVVDATDNTNKPILAYQKHGGKNQQVSDFDTSYPVSWTSMQWKYHVVSEEDHTFHLESMSTSLSPSNEKWAHAGSVEAVCDNLLTNDLHWPRIIN